MFVVGIIRPQQMTRASVPGRPWAYQTKAAFSDGTKLAVCGQLAKGPA